MKSIILVLAFLLLYTWHATSQILPTCLPAAFPKVLGGIAGDTVINQMDYYAGSDSLVTCGYLCDTNLRSSNPYTGSQCVGMLALYQGFSKARSWAITINDYRQLMTVAFSNNG